MLRIAAYGGVGGVEVIECTQWSDPDSDQYTLAASAVVNRVQTDRLTAQQLDMRLRSGAVTADVLAQSG